MNDQLTHYITRRSACTLPDGTRPYAWWKRHQRRISEAKTISDAEIRKDAERMAKAQTALLGDDE